MVDVLELNLAALLNLRSEHSRINVYIYVKHISDTNVTHEPTNQPKEKLRLIELFGLCV